MNKQISIILPVYNGEKYISRCVESILNQRFSINKLEILLINDGSTDNSLKFIKLYQNKYPEIIKAIDQENIGAANTRNKGVRLASGKYILFIDQDDTIDHDYCKRLYDAIESDKCDVVQAGFKRVNKDGTIVQMVLPTHTEFGKFLSIPAWMKIHRTQFLRNNNIYFFNNNIGEDNVFTAKEIILAKKYGFLDYAGYNNSFDNDVNVTNSLHKGLSPDVNIINLLDELSLITSSNVEINAMLQYNVVRTAAYYLLSYGRSASRARFIEVSKEIFDWIEGAGVKYLKNKYLFRRPKGESMVAHLGVQCLVLLQKLHLMHIFAKVYCK